MGAKRVALRRLVLAEALVLGVVAGLAGLVLGVAAAFGLDAVAVALLPDVPFKPGSFVAFPPLLLASAWLLGALGAVVGAWGPAMVASRADPAAALRA
jgi:putative ABC transport system permease protein